MTYFKQKLAPSLKMISLSLAISFAGVSSVSFASTNSTDALLTKISGELQQNTQAWNHFYNGPSGLKETNEQFTMAKQAPLFTTIMGNDNDMLARVQSPYTQDYPTSLANMGLPQGMRTLNKQTATTNLLSYTNGQHIEELQTTLNQVLAAQQAAAKQRTKANKALGKIAMILSQVYKGQYHGPKPVDHRVYIIGQAAEEAKKAAQQKLINEYYNTHPNN